MGRRVPWNAPHHGGRGVGTSESTVVTCLLEVNSSWGGGKMRVHYRKWVSLEVYIHGLEILKKPLFGGGSL